MNKLKIVLKLQFPFHEVLVDNSLEHLTRMLPWGRYCGKRVAINHLALFLSSSPDSQKVSVELSLRLPIIACRLDTFSSRFAVTSTNFSTEPSDSQRLLALFSVVFAAALSSSSDLERIRLMVEKTWERCRNWWSEGRNLMPQQVIAICANKRQIIRSNSFNSILLDTKEDMYSQLQKLSEIVC